MPALQTAQLAMSGFYPSSPLTVGPSPLMMSGAFPMQFMMGAAQMRAAHMAQPMTAMFIPEEHTDAASIQIAECNAVSGFSCLASHLCFAAHMHHQHL